jgi:ferredoxin
MKSFLSRFGPFVLFLLSGFDRLRFAGESRLLNHARGVQSYLWQQHILFKDFPAHALHLTRTLRRQTEARARQDGVPLQPLNSPSTDKEATALQLAQCHPGRSSCIAVLSCVESCSTYRLRKNAQGLIEPHKEAGRCLHYYHYFQHPDLGLCYVRIQSWFPFAVRVGLNGRAWLAQQLR